MSSPRIVAVLVRCTESLLLCEDIPTDTLSFRDMPDCTVQLPALIDSANRLHFGQVVMGRCHYVVGRRSAEPASRPSDGRSPQAAALESEQASRD